MLVAAFEIEVGRRLQVRPLARFEDKGVRAAAIEPDVENVGHPLIILGAIGVAEQRLGGLIAPGIDALFADCRDDPGVHGLIDQILARLAVDKQRDRHAPGALAGQNPVRASFHH
jgi:hypothetical protein